MGKLGPVGFDDPHALLKELSPALAGLSLRVSPEISRDGRGGLTTGDSRGYSSLAHEIIGDGLNAGVYTRGVFSLRTPASVPSAAS